jgi:hypothetical protein
LEWDHAGEDGAIVMYQQQYQRESRDSSQKRRRPDTEYRRKGKTTTPRPERDNQGGPEDQFCRDGGISVDQ